MPRWRLLGARGVNDAPGEIGLAYRASAVRADLGCQQISNPEFGHDSEHYGIDAGAIGMCEFGQVANAHQYFDFRIAFAHRVIAQ